MSSGGTTSSPELALDLQSVMVNGRGYLVSTADVERSGREGIGKNRRTAEMVGGGAVLGTLLGAIAGGGKGAAIGAIAGAAAGGTAQVLTKGKEVKVPAETLLTFRLDEPVRLQPR
jgi:outer membrane lipoprotein SlyB